MALSGKITDFGVPESRVLEVPKLDSPSEKLRVWVQTVSVIHMQTKTVRRSMNLCQHDCTVHHRCYSPSTMGSLITRGLSLSSNAVNRVKVLPAWFSGNFCRKPAGFSAGKITPKWRAFPADFPRHRKVPDSHRKLSSKLGMDGSQTCQTLVKMCYIMLYHSF